MARIFEKVLGSLTPRVLKNVSQCTMGIEMSWLVVVTPAGAAKSRMWRRSRDEPLRARLEWTAAILCMVEVGRNDELPI